MKRKALAVLGLVAVLTSSSVIGVSASEFVDGRDARSNATFAFDNEDGDGDGEGTTPPVDPEEPDEGVDPENPGTGNEGDLRIDYVSNFKFGAHKITSGKQVFNAALVDVNNNTKKVPNYVQLTDVRGTGAGWSLYVQQDQFKVVSSENEDNIGKDLRGAKIQLHNITPNTENLAGKATIPTSSIVLEGNDAKKEVMTAAGDISHGTHVAYFGDYKNKPEAEQSAKESVQLVVPAGSNKLQAGYKSVLTWTLSDTPGNSGE